MGNQVEILFTLREILYLQVLNAIFNVFLKGIPYYYKNNAFVLRWGML